MHFLILNFQTLRIFTTFLQSTRVEVFLGVFRTCSSSQVSQNGSAVCEFVKPEGGQNKIISSAENTTDIEEKHDNGNNNNIATFNGERLEGKFVSGNVINLSRRNLSEAEMYLLSKGLKFVPTANKIDRAKF